MGHTDTADHNTGELYLLAFPFTVSLAVGVGPLESTYRIWLKVMSSLGHFNRHPLFKYN